MQASTPRTWVEQGLISFEQAEAIEGRRGLRAPHRAVEILTYLGAAALLVAAVVWYGDLLIGAGFGLRADRPWPAFGVALAAAAVLAGVGIALRGDPGGTGRASGLVLALGVVMADLAAVAAFWAMGWTGDWSDLGRSLAIVGAALAAWMLRRSVPTQVIVFLAAYNVASAVTVMARDLDPARFIAPAVPMFFLNPAEALTEPIGAALVWALGSAWLYAGFRGAFRSANTACLLGGAAAVGGAATLAVDSSPWWLFLLVPTALALCLGGVYVRRTILLLAGGAGLLLAPVIGIAGWSEDLPAARTWVMIYGIPGSVLLAAALTAADRARRRAPSGSPRPSP